MLNSKQIITDLKNVNTIINNYYIRFIHKEHYKEAQKLRKESIRKGKQIDQLLEEFDLQPLFSICKNDLESAERLLKNEELTDAEYLIANRIIDFWINPDLLSYLFSPGELSKDPEGNYSRAAKIMLEFIATALILHRKLLPKAIPKHVSLSTFQEYAKYYFDLGLNVSCITKDVTGFNSNEKNISKSPSHEWKNLYNEKQSYDLLMQYNWKNSIGVGVILGFNNIRAIDIDDCTDIGFIDKILEILKLPFNYEWVVLSGSGKGFHIIISNETKFIELFNGHLGILTAEENLKEDVAAFKPNNNNIDKFSRIEFRWENHLVLPPSIHDSSFKYQFINGTLPNSLPTFVEPENIINLILKSCDSVVSARPSHHEIKLKISHY